ncbi:type I methionyl aminopeptidase [Candidatus Parcubacteria bacterium]|nr:type I methionyl aminopeptidase [Candidatus Parcubacteria bacterium]
MIHLKSPQEIEIMREGGKVLAQIMQELANSAKPGISTLSLEILARKLIKQYKTKCAFLGYQNYPACLCTSVNEEIVHVPPSERVLKEGDILKIDLGILWKGYYLDMAQTIALGKLSFEAQRLIRVTKKALKLAIKKARPGNTTGDIGNVIERYVLDAGFSPIKELCGHGIGKRLHEDPQILNYGKRKEGEILREGMVICIEPMVAIGSGKIKKTKDGFGYQTEDGSLSAHFEHTIAITKKGPEILTQI